MAVRNTCTFNIIEYADKQYVSLRTLIIATLDKQSSFAVPAGVAAHMAVRNSHAAVQSRHTMERGGKVSESSQDQVHP